jgi:hypothetical protein
VPAAPWALNTDVVVSGFADPALCIDSMLLPQELLDLLCV